MFKPVKSSFIESAEYDGENKLQVKLKNGGHYEYEKVTPELYSQFEATFDKESKDASSGGFYGQHIKSLPFKKLG